MREWGNFPSHYGQKIDAAINRGEIEHLWISEPKAEEVLRETVDILNTLERNSSGVVNYSSKRLGDLPEQITED